MPVKSSSRKSRASREQMRALDVQIQFMEGVVRRDPRYVEALQLLGDNYTKRGRYNEGLTVDERLAQLEPDNPLVFYNLACSYSLTDQCDRAADAIEGAGWVIPIQMAGQGSRPPQTARASPLRANP
jgi:tetratricopeptide (TPR) repeat protein